MVDGAGDVVGGEDREEEVGDGEGSGAAGEGVEGQVRASVGRTR